MVSGQWGNLARTPGLHPYSFSKDILGFIMTTENQDNSLTSHPKDGAFFFTVYSIFTVCTFTVCIFTVVSPSLYWGVRTYTHCKVSTPCWSH